MSCREGGVCHTGVGWVMQGCGGVGHVGVWCGGSCRGGWGVSCRGGVGGSCRGIHIQHYMSD